VPPASLSRGFPGRVLLLAESAGRRETLSGLFLGIRTETTGEREFFSDFMASDSRLSLAVGPLHDGFLLDQLAIITEAELYADSPSRRTRHVAQRRTSARQLAARPHRTEGGFAGGA
jgi:transcription-repair coupling factor (superfamily II helicase)